MTVFARKAVGFACLAVLLCLMALTSVPTWGQATIQSGSISGTITDPSGAAVPSAKMTITSESTGQKISITSSSAGTYNSGPLGPGIYTVLVEVSGFARTEVKTEVSVGTISPINIKLEVAGTSQVITVEATGLHVNTEQSTVQGVITSEQIENLPTNGRNFLAIAGLEPGVQIQDGGNFDPTKIGFIGISVGGRQGRTTRIEVDGLDVSDETVGTTTQNIPASSIQEFQISQSSLDFSTELTSSGAVNIATKSGTKDYHGDFFYLFRDKRAGGADFPDAQDNPYQRNHIGGTFGGPIVQQKLFFFIAGERVLQRLFAPVTFSPPFNVLSGGYQSPYREKEVSGRLDYNLLGNAKLFYKFSYDNNTVVGNLLPNYSAFANLDNTPSHAVGLDWTTGRFTHSVRFGYLKFQNHISDAVAITGAFNPLPNAPAEYRITGISPQLRFGPNHLAPQATFQSNKQIKYDGSMTWGSHIFRYGGSFNRILGGGFAAFYGIGPAIRSRASRAGAVNAKGSANPFPSLDKSNPANFASNPLNYPVTTSFLGNGQGFFTEIPEFGLPAGGQFDSRAQFYVGDSWKIRRNFTLTIGLRHNRDTGRTDSDLGPIPCSAIDTANFSPAPPCTGNLLDNFGNVKGLGNAVNQPNGNWGGTLGIAWDPFGNGKTVIRAGGGVYYENAVFNNVLFDRPVRLQKGLFFTITPGSGNMCPQGVVQFPGGVNVKTTPTGKDIATQICGQPIGSVAGDIVALQKAYQAAVAKAGASTNPNFVGETLDPNAGGNLYAPNYETPRSFQMNVGVQREVWKGGIVSADYVRNVSLRYLLGVDTNHVGDARFLNVTASKTAIAATTAGFGCAGGTSSAAINCAIAAGAVIDDFANNGLDSGVTYLGGSPAEAFGLNPLTDGAAFGGINPFYGTNTALFPVGRSVYNGLLVTFKQRKENLLPYFSRTTLHFSYALSRFESMAGDQDFINTAFDQANPTRFFGPASFDRRHQISFGTTFGFAKMHAFEGVQLSVFGRFASPLPTTLVLEDQSRAGEIFHTDRTGDGTTGDIPQGLNIGSFGRSVGPGSLAAFVSQYNKTQAGTLTPAGQALVSAGLFTQAQLVALGAVNDAIPAPVAGAVGNDWSRTLDAKVSFPFKIGERVRIDPSFAFFNVLNFANFGGASGLSGVLNGAPGAAGYTTYNQQGNRVGLGSGVFQAGAPRQVEFGLRISF